MHVEEVESLGVFLAGNLQWDSVPTIDNASLLFRRSRDVDVVTIEQWEATQDRVELPESGRSETAHLPTRRYQRLLYAE